MLVSPSSGANMELRIALALPFLHLNGPPLPVVD